MRARRAVAEPLLFVDSGDLIMFYRKCYGCQPRNNGWLWWSWVVGVILWLVMGGAGKIIGTCVWS